jgi:hypothetical protein
MKRRRRFPAFKRPSALRVEADVATDTAATPARRPRGNRYAAMKLPHEQDQSPDHPGKPGDVTAQAASDVESGQVDTDCYDAAGTRFDRQQRRR